MGFGAKRMSPAEALRKFSAAASQRGLSREPKAPANLLAGVKDGSLEKLVGTMPVEEGAASSVPKVADSAPKQTATTKFGIDCCLLGFIWRPEQALGHLQVAAWELSRLPREHCWQPLPQLAWCLPTCSVTRPASRSARAF